MFILIALGTGCGGKHHAPGGEEALPGFAFQNGDLLFQDLDCGELCEAIEKVTPRWQGRPLSHVGIVEVEDTHLVVIEAIGKEVQKTPVHRFLDRNRDSEGRPKVLVGRLKATDQHLVERALAFCNTQLGKPYDEAFLPGNDKYYCSELLYEAFRFANDGREVFALAPMTFIDPGTGTFFPAWVGYYEALGMPLPEGLPGCNPGGIANDQRVEVVRAFY